MSEHKAQLSWKRKTESFDYEKYNRDHLIIFFNGKVTIKASAAAYHCQFCLDQSGCQTAGMINFLKKEWRKSNGNY